MASQTEKLEAAAQFYNSLRSLPSEGGWVGYLFEGMTEYAEDKLGITKPEHVRQVIFEVRAHLGELDVIDIEQELFRRCQQHLESGYGPVTISTENWGENLTGSAIEYFKEDYNPMLQVGTKVVTLSGTRDAFTIKRYGIVRANKLAFIVEHDPFDENHGSGWHDYAVYHPKRNNFKDADGDVDVAAYCEAENEYDKKRVQAQANIQADAKLLDVEWCDCNGNVLARSWESAAKLREFTDEDAAFDASLSLVDIYGNPPKAGA